MIDKFEKSISLLMAHERSITKIRYNRKGDLLFSSGKDRAPSVWYSINGERLGSYNGHTGTVWCIDVNWDTTSFVSAAGDSTMKLWDVQTGQLKTNYTHEVPCRICAFSYDRTLVLYSSDESMGRPCELFVVDLKEGPSKRINVSLRHHRKVTGSLWGTFDEFIVTGHENGELVQWNMKAGEEARIEQPHTLQIMDLQTDKDLTLEILMHLKTYVTKRPINSAAISPIRDHVSRRGQEAIEVTQTLAQTGKFEARFFHLIFEEEFARGKGHFGPINNSLAFHPDGKRCVVLVEMFYASGGEDGFVRLQYFDPDYLEYHLAY
ncbi:unnamed protein product [Didymodactylos carnosus]|uniref:Serine-threonine kinase receptor-associated protein n=1 Tax=Didymodactylos carnosus TaxID=1234261 RepID=A0A813R0P5_9BILA|nr:unnamed protein product [Didymodactylos carnosus]CAF3556088.1 unnamed protein product [Didymodactylos carnosus]